ncbi:hypothetical protein KJ966_06480 [bacterium]|nr:hypothetical protein [bacterium]
MTNNEIYDRLKAALKKEIEKNSLRGNRIEITCRALSSKEAIGTPEHDDYPIIKGKEVMIEAVFKGASGQAFTDEFRNCSYPVEKLLEADPSSTPDRANFIAGLNAVFKYLQLCDKTVHCRDKEPVDCAKHLITQSEFFGKKILLVGFQPRFLEYLTKQNPVRVLDLDPDNVNREHFGVTIETSEQASAAINWCDIIFATGSTLVNGTISEFLKNDKPTVFFGVTISAAASILGLNTYCHCGH